MRRESHLGKQAKHANCLRRQRRCGGSNDDEKCDDDSDHSRLSRRVDTPANSLKRIHLKVHFEEELLI